MRFEDPWAAEERGAIATYSRYLDLMMEELVRSTKAKQENAAFRRVKSAEGRIAEARGLLDQAAGKRLVRAIAIVTEERDNLDRYRLEINGTNEETRVLAGEVLEAAINDVIGEVLNLVTRSEVGLLDVAWSIQESEMEEIRRLDMNRARDLREIERNLDQGLGELQ